MPTFGLPDQRQEGPGGPDHAVDVDVSYHQVLPHRRQLHASHEVVARVVHQAPQTWKLKLCQTLTYRTKVSTKPDSH